MADHRMFSRTIIASARFLRMPPTSRLLYYDLGMAADDDGVAEAYGIMRMTGATDDDLRVLVAKGFVRILNEDLVTVIVDWKQNNIIKKDRYRPSIYAALLRIPSEPEPIRNQVGTEPEPQVKSSKGKLSEAIIPVEELPHVERDDLVIYISESLSPMNADILDEVLSFRDQLGDDMVKEAVKTTLSNGTRKPAYCKSILNRWLSAGYKSMADVKADDEKRKAAFSRQVPAQKPMISREPVTDDGDFYSEIMSRPRMNGGA